MATLAVADTGICREMFADRTNITPRDAIERRKIVIVNMPPDEWGDVGAVANIGWKYHWQNDVLRREITRRSPITCIWGDESSLWVTPSDAHYLSRCRSYRGWAIYMKTKHPDVWLKIQEADDARRAKVCGVLIKGSVELGRRVVAWITPQSP